MDSLKKIKLTAGLSATLLLGGGVAIDERIDPYEDKGTKLEIVAESILENAGTNKVELEKARPAVTLSKWNDEAGMTVVYDKVKGQGSRQLFTDRMEWKDAKEEVHAYPLPAGEGMEDGGFEIEVVLNEKPDTNVFDFKIEGADELDFWYQSLESCTEENIFCPENVIGSYAVYHKTKANHIVGETNYATGKAFHIFRPKAIDANGVEQWAELSYFDGVLTVTVPQDWLEQATYPVRVDPTFGRTTIGASTNALGSQDAAGSEFTSPADSHGATVTSISYYASSTGGAVNTKGQLYLKDGGGAGTHTTVSGGRGSVVTAPTPVGWATSSSMTATIASSTVYIIGFVMEGAVSIRRDSTGSHFWLESSANDYTTESSLSDGTAGVGFASIYATYTVAPASTTPVLTTDAATSIGTDTATLNAEITDDGGASITQHGFAWGTNSSLSGGDTATTTLGAGAEGVFDEVRNSLTPATIYYFRAYAVNSEGTSTASILNFTTDAVAEETLTPYATIKGDVQMKGDVYFSP